MRLMRFGFNGGGFLFNDTVSANMTNYNLAARATAAGWNGVLALIANVSISASARITSTNVLVPAFDATGTFPAGSNLTLVIAAGGSIVGRGGVGGAGGLANNDATGFPGGVGGTGISVGLACSINSAGTIGGGGGGAGGGGPGNNAGTAPLFFGRGGGGGGGACLGTGYPFVPAGSNSQPGAAGIDGGETTGGAGGGGSQAGGTGGTGGAIGSVGGTGSAGAQGAGGAGGAAGAAVVGNSNINWIATGTRIGAIT